MSFKSKQRAKHGHLFGDDPLNASSTPSSPTDPLSRSSSPTNNSIFGGIDVSKFSNRRSTSSVRSASKLVDDENDSDFLFSGKTSTPKRATPPSPPPRLSSPHKEEEVVPVKKPPPPPPRRPVSVSTSPSPSSPILSKSPQLAVPPPPPPRTHTKHKHQQQVVKPLDQPSPDTLEETRNMQQQKAAMMQDEATRAFAMDDAKPLGLKLNYDNDDPELYQSITAPFHALSTSSSTPTLKTPNGSATNPWDTFGPTPIATTTTPLPKEKDIEPAKRAAFADLIAHWHGNRKQPPLQPPDEEEDAFLTSVASEQRDVGFAGIDGGVPRSSSFGWQQDSLVDDNPWS